MLIFQILISINKNVENNFSKIIRLLLHSFQRGKNNVQNILRIRQRSFSTFFGRTIWQTFFYDMKRKQSFYRILSLIEEQLGAEFILNCSYFFHSSGNSPFLIEQICAGLLFDEITAAAAAGFSSKIFSKTKKKIRNCFENYANSKESFV